MRVPIKCWTDNMTLRRTQVIELWRQESIGPPFLFKNQWKTNILIGLLRLDLNLEQQSNSNIAVCKIVNDKKCNLKLLSISQKRQRFWWSLTMKVRFRHFLTTCVKIKKVFLKNTFFDQNLPLVAKLFYLLKTPPLRSR